MTERDLLELCLECKTVGDSTTERLDFCSKLLDACEPLSSYSAEFTERRRKRTWQRIAMVCRGILKDQTCTANEARHRLGIRSRAMFRNLVQYGGTAAPLSDGRFILSAVATSKFSFVRRRNGKVIDLGCRGLPLPADAFKDWSFPRKQRRKR